MGTIADGWLETRAMNLTNSKHAHALCAAVIAGGLIFGSSSAIRAQESTNTSERIEKKESEIKKKEAELNQKERDLSKKQAGLDKLKEDLKYQETAQSISINLKGDVLFDFGKAAIRPEAEAALDKVGTVIQQFPNAKVRIEGYTDAKGGAKENLALSREPV